MTNRNDTIAPSRPADGNHPADVNRYVADPHAAPAAHSRHHESVESIVSDVEQFARGWIGRIRRLIHRSSQLIERESLLAGAIARLDQQKAEWHKRTSAKEEALRDQSKRLTEAWLQVEAERRKALQGARAAATGMNNANSGPVLAAPVAPAAGAQPVVAPKARVISNPALGTPNQQLMPQAPTGQPPVTQPQAAPARPQVIPPAVNVPVASPNTPISNRSVINANPIGVNPVGVQVTPVANTPISTGGMATTHREAEHDEAFEQAEAATRQKIEEFKRMQRAIRSNRNN